MAESGATLNGAGESHARSLIRDDKIDNGAWSFDGADGDALLGKDGDDWTTYGSYHLGIDSGESEKTKAHYKYPFGKAGKVYVAALRAISSRAAQEGATAIGDAATKLREEAEKGKEPPGEKPDEDDSKDKMAKSQGDRMTILADVRMVDIQAADEGGQPRPARFEMVANTGKVPMTLAGWRYPVILDMSGVDIPSQNLPMRLNHDKTQGVGHSDSVTIENGQILARGVISRKTNAADDVRESAKQGFPWQASVGASAGETEFVKEGQSATVNGVQFSGPINVVRKSVLGEISFVDRGADGDTSVRVAAMAKDGDQESNGQNVAATGNAADIANSINNSLERTKVERLRVEAIGVLAQEYSTYAGANIDAIQKITSEAIAAGTAPKDLELQLLRHSRPKAPAIHRVEAHSGRVLEAALGIACGLSDEDLSKDRSYGNTDAERDLTVSRAYGMRNIGLQGVVRAALQSAGQSIPHGSEDLYRAAIELTRRPQTIEAEGFSTVNLPGILGNIANKILLQAFLAIDVVYDKIADQADFTNFHTHTMFRLISSGTFQKLGPDGELHMGNLSQDSYTNKVDTSGELLVLTRQNIINDDLNAFRTLTTQMARKARIAVERALFGQIMESTNVFYTTAHGNLQTTSALGIETLGSAEQLLIGMVDSNGDPIYAEGKFLLVPPALKQLADRIFTSDLVNDFTTGAARPTDNPYKGSFQVATSPFLNSATMPGYSPTTWYLLTSPLMIPAFQVAYLNGRRAPTVETAETMFNMLGMQMRCYFDFGTTQVDYRGAIKSTA